MAEYVDPKSMLSITFQDASSEFSNVSVYTEQVTALNFAAQVLLQAAIIAAMRNVTLCNPYTSNLQTAWTKYNMGVPASPWAQRELGLQVGLIDTVNQKKSHITIPGVDWNTLHGDGDWVNYNHASWTALKAAIEAGAVSQDGNPVEVVYGRLVGRRS